MDSLQKLLAESEALECRIRRLTGDSVTMPACSPKRSGRVARDFAELQLILLTSLTDIGLFNAFSSS